MSPIYIEHPRHSSSSLREHPRHSSSSLHEHPRHSSSALDDASRRMNTPWSTPPSSTASTAPRRRRSSSVHDHRHHSTSPTRPLIVQKPHQHHSHHRSSSPNRYATKTLTLTPASSRNDTQYHNRTARYYDALASKQESGRILPRQGRTRFPRKLVSREAAEELKLPYALEADGAVTVLQALGQPDIDTLVALTEELRHRHRHHHRRSHSRGEKAVSFYEKTVVHEVPPTPTHAPRPVVMVPGGKQRYESSYLADSPPKFEPLSPPGPSTPRPQTKTLEFNVMPGTKTPEQKIAKAEAKAAKAENRFVARGHEEDRIEALKARRKVEELRRKMDGRRSLGVKVGRNQRGEVVIVKG